MDKIIYQGQQIEVEPVAYISGETTVNPLKDLVTDEALYHDHDQDRYYLVRDLNRYRDEHRKLVHRLIRKEMAEHEERQGDEWHNTRVDELQYLNRRIQACENVEEGK